MPLFTEQYHLASFLQGDVYSSTLDAARMICCDNQLSLISDIIQDGVISGWEVSSENFPVITVAPGSGMVDGFFVSTQNSVNFTLESNTTSYVLIKRISDLTVANGCVSDLLQIIYTDLTAPASPSGLSAVNNYLNSNAPSNSMIIDLSWNSNSETDFSHYNIYRSTNNSDFDFVSESESSTFSDSLLQEDTTYYYKVSSVDTSGNESSFSAASVTTPITTFLPPNPKNVVIYPSNESISVCWEEPANFSTDLISNYLITYSLLDTDNSVISTKSISVNSSAVCEKITLLENNHKYLITLYTVDTQSRQSTGLTSISIPTNGLNDPQNVLASSSATESAANVKLSLSWTPPGDEYSTSTNLKYRIYTTIDKYGTTESRPVETTIGQTSIDLRLINYSTGYRSIPEQSVVTTRITTLQLDGKESKGILVRTKIGKYTTPQKVRNPNASFDLKKITVTWGNNSDTYKVKVTTYKKQANEPYSDYAFVSEVVLQNTNVFIVDTPDLDFTYKFVLTPIDKYGTTGESSSLTIDIPAATELQDILAPNNFVGSGFDGIINLKWQRPTDENNLITKFLVYRAQGEGVLDFAEFSLIDELSPNITHYSDYGVDPDQTYTYFIVSEDLYGRQSLNPSNGYYNINTVSVSAPISSGLEPVVGHVSLAGNDIVLEWSNLPGETFDSFEILRSIDNRNSWISIATVNTEELTTDYSYTDTNIATTNGQKFYYVIRKISNNSSVVISGDLTEENTLLIATAITSDSSVTTNNDVKRNLANLHDPIIEKTDASLLLHRHGGSKSFDPEKVDLNSSLIVTDWTTTDGKTWKTTEDISEGEIYDLSVNSEFPTVIYKVFSDESKILFADPISTTSLLKLTVYGINEVSNILSVDKFDNIHARQIALGRLTLDQLPDLDHNGVTKEPIYPIRSTLKMYDTHTYQSNASDKLFGDATTFFAITDKSAIVEEFQSFDNSTVGTTVLFNNPENDSYTIDNIVSGSSEVTVEQAFDGDKSYKVTIKFKDTQPQRWVKLNTSGFNPVVNLSKHLGFRIMVMSGSFYLGIGVRKSENGETTPGSDGGITNSQGKIGDIEFVGVTEVTEYGDLLVPKGQYLLSERPGFWRDVQFDFTENVHAFTGDGNLSTTTGYATLEHLAITVNTDEEIVFFIDSIEQRSDILAGSTSNGLMTSDNFGQSWSVLRYTETPIHKFYKASINGFLWGISSKKVYYSSNTEQWFEIPGIENVHFVYDIVEDVDGDMFVSTDKGVFILRTATYSAFFELTKTKYVTSLSSSTYAIWYTYPYVYVSTDFGIFKSQDKGEKWTDSGFLSDDPEPILQVSLQDTDLIAISETSVYRKLLNESKFVSLSNITESIDTVTSLWKFDLKNNSIFVSTNDGIYTNVLDVLFDPTVLTAEFDRVFPETETNNIPQPATEIKNINNNLFIATENKLFVSNDTVNLVTNYQSKDSPRFFVDGNEIKTNYTYSCFNNVLSLKIAPGLLSTVEGEQLPRKKYQSSTQWAQRDINADVLIYLNGVPTWIDFAFDTTDFTQKVQDILDNLSGSTEPELRVIQSGNVILTPLVTTKTVSQFLSDYSYLISTNDSMPVTTLNGANNTNRQPKTVDVFSILSVSDLGYTSTLSSLIDFDSFVRAFEGGYLESELQSKLSTAKSNGAGTQYDLAVKTVIDKLNTKTSYTIDTKAEIETELGFSAKNSTGIIIDANHGLFDFTTYLSTNKTSFKKEDKLTVSIFGCTISNIGINSHDQIEDGFEFVNSGMHSSLTDVVTGNFIKNGIFLDRQFGTLEENTTSYIKSYYKSISSGSYDVLNSTVDYALVSSNKEVEIPEIVLSTLWITDEYLGNRLWIGTDVGILEYEFVSGSLNYSRLITINSEYVYINQLLQQNDSILVCTNTTIFETFDFGTTWTELNTKNLPSQINNIGVANGTIIAATSEGLWWSPSDQFGFSKAALTTSSRLAGQNKIDSELAFIGNIINLECNNFSFAESELEIYISNNGASFFGVGDLTQSTVTNISKMIFFKKILWVATDQGLYSDSGTVFSDRIQFALIQTSDSFSTSQSAINDLSTDGEILYAAQSDGTLLFFKDDAWNRFDTNLGTLQKIQVMSDGYIACLGYNTGIVVNINSLNSDSEPTNPVTVIDLGACT